MATPTTAATLVPNTHSAATITTNNSTTNVPSASMVTSSQRQIHQWCRLWLSKLSAKESAVSVQGFKEGIVPLCPPADHSCEIRAHLHWIARQACRRYQQTWEDWCVGWSRLLLLSEGSDEWQRQVEMYLSPIWLYLCEWMSHYPRMQSLWKWGQRQVLPPTCLVKDEEWMDKWTTWTHQWYQRWEQIVRMSTGMLPILYLSYDHVWQVWQDCLYGDWNNRHEWQTLIWPSLVAEWTQCVQALSIPTPTKNNIPSVVYLKKYGIVIAQKDVETLAKTLQNQPDTEQGADILYSWLHKMIIQPVNEWWLQFTHLMDLQPPSPNIVKWTQEWITLNQQWRMPSGFWSHKRLASGPRLRRLLLSPHHATQFVRYLDALDHYRECTRTVLLQVFQSTRLEPMVISNLSDWSMHQIRTALTLSERTLVYLPVPATMTKHSMCSIPLSKSGTNHNHIYHELSSVALEQVETITTQPAETSNESSTITSGTSKSVAGFSPNATSFSATVSTEKQTRAAASHSSMGLLTDSKSAPYNTKDPPDSESLGVVPPTSSSSTDTRPMTTPCVRKRMSLPEASTSPCSLSPNVEIIKLPIVHRSSSIRKRFGASLDFSISDRPHKKVRPTSALPPPTPSTGVAAEKNRTHLSTTQVAE